MSCVSLQQNATIAETLHYLLGSTELDSVRTLSRMPNRYCLQWLGCFKEMHPRAEINFAKAVFCQECYDYGFGPSLHQNLDSKKHL